MPRMSRKNKGRYYLLKELQDALSEHDALRLQVRKVKTRISAAMRKLNVHVWPTRVRRARGASKEAE